MISVSHLIDDASFGGVTRFLDALEPALGSNVRQTRCVTDMRGRLPERFDADVVVVHGTMNWAKLPFLLALRLQRRRRSIVLVEHSYCEGFERLAVPNPARFHLMLRLAYGLADRVVAVSYGQAAWMRRRRLLPAAKLAIISPFTRGEELLALHAPAAHGSAHPGPLRLGAYGRYCAQKDFETLLAAMRLVDPAVAMLTLRGFGPDADTLVQQARELSHVTVGPRVDDLATFLRDIDAVVVPSRFEPFGQVALEARWAGRPLIVTDIDGLPEQVAPGTGMIVPVGAPESLAQAIRSLAALGHEGRLKAMGQAARDGALDHRASSAERWLQLLDDLSGNFAAGVRRHVLRIASA